MRDCPFCGRPVSMRGELMGVPFISHIEGEPAKNCIYGGRVSDAAVLAALWNRRSGVPDLPDETPSQGKGVEIERENA